MALATVPSARQIPQSVTARQIPKGAMSEEDARRLEEELKKAGQEAGQTLQVPPENVALFRKYEADIRQYAMSGLAFIGL